MTGRKFVAAHWVPNEAHKVRAALMLRSLTWPKPLMVSGTLATLTA
ncbi:MAG: hypothetical protein RJB17_1216, partial [Pseudomonadota bacterium]